MLIHGTMMSSSDDVSFNASLWALTRRTTTSKYRSSLPVSSGTTARSREAMGGRGVGRLGQSHGLLLAFGSCFVSIRYANYGQRLANASCRGRAQRRRGSWEPQPPFHNTVRGGGRTDRQRQLPEQVQRVERAGRGARVAAAEDRGQEEWHRYDGQDVRARGEEDGECNVAACGRRHEYACGVRVSVQRKASSHTALMIYVSRAPMAPHPQPPRARLALACLHAPLLTVVGIAMKSARPCGNSGGDIGMRATASDSRGDSPRIEMGRRCTQRTNM